MRETTWVILEITPKGEEEARCGRLRRLISNRSNIAESDIYIPLIRAGRDPVFLMEGYIFIKSGYPASEYVSLKRTPWISNLLAKIDQSTGMISSGTVKDSQLKQMLKRADDLGGKFKAGDEVEIKGGEMKGFNGVIMDSWVNEEGLRHYGVLVELRSVEIIVSVDCLSVEG